MTQIQGISKTKCLIKQSAAVILFSSHEHNLCTLQALGYLSINWSKNWPSAITTKFLLSHEHQHTNPESWRCSPLNAALLQRWSFSEKSQRLLHCIKDPSAFHYMMKEQVILWLQCGKSINQCIQQKMDISLFPPLLHQNVPRTKFN